MSDLEPAKSNMDTLRSGDISRPTRLHSRGDVSDGIAEHDDLGYGETVPQVQRCRQLSEAEARSTLFSRTVASANFGQPQ
jgi:hypothetical protein